MPWVSIAVIKYPRKKKFREKGFVFSSTWQPNIIIESRNSIGQKPTGRNRSHIESWRNAAYWIAPRGQFILPFYVTQDHLPRSGTHCWLYPPTSITNSDLTLQICLFLWKRFNNYEILFLDNSDLCQIDKKNLVSTRHHRS